jgi:hypothetical protein
MRGLSNYSKPAKSEPTVLDVRVDVDVKAFSAQQPAQLEHVRAVARCLGLVVVGDQESF